MGLVVRRMLTFFNVDGLRHVNISNDFSSIHWQSSIIIIKDPCWLFISRSLLMILMILEIFSPLLSGFLLSSHWKTDCSSDGVNLGSMAFSKYRSFMISSISFSCFEFSSLKFLFLLPMEARMLEMLFK